MAVRMGDIVRRDEGGRRPRGASAEAGLMPRLKAMAKCLVLGFVLPFSQAIAQGQYFVAAQIAATRAECLPGELKLVDKTIDIEIYVTRDLRSRTCVITCKAARCTVSKL
jgi:hypothetical protein